MGACVGSAIEVNLEKVNNRTECGRTQLFDAAECGDYDAAKLLIKHGADVNVQDFHGNTALITAADSSVYFHSKYCLPIMRLLLKNGADPNLKNMHGVTALMKYSSSHYNPNGVILLLRYGADPDLVDKNGERAIDRADGLRIKLVLSKPKEFVNIMTEAE